MGKQTDLVIETMRKNGGYATLKELYSIVDTSEWKTKTPKATIRRIVQISNGFFKVKPGLWALKEYEKDVLEKLAKENKC